MFIGIYFPYLYFPWDNFRIFPRRTSSLSYVPLRCSSWGWLFLRIPHCPRPRSFHAILLFVPRLDSSVHPSLSRVEFRSPLIPSSATSCTQSSLSRLAPNSVLTFISFLPHALSDPARRSAGERPESAAPADINKHLDYTVKADLESTRSLVEESS